MVHPIYVYLQGDYRYQTLEIDGRDESWEARRPAGRWWPGQTDQAVVC